jgi:hypothetical protein
MSYKLGRILGGRLIVAVSNVCNPCQANEHALASSDCQLLDLFLQKVSEFIQAKGYLAIILRSNVKKLAPVKRELRWGWVSRCSLEEIL